MRQTAFGSGTNIRWTAECYPLTVGTLSVDCQYAICRLSVLQREFTFSTLANAVQMYRTFCLASLPHVVRNCIQMWTRLKTRHRTYSVLSTWKQRYYLILTSPHHPTKPEYPVWGRTNIRFFFFLKRLNGYYSIANCVDLSTHLTSIMNLFMDSILGIPHYFVY